MGGRKVYAQNPFLERAQDHFTGHVNWTEVQRRSEHHNIRVTKGWCGKTFVLRAVHFIVHQTKSYIQTFNFHDQCGLNNMCVHVMGLLFIIIPLVNINYCTCWVPGSCLLPPLMIIPVEEGVYPRY